MKGEMQVLSPFPYIVNGQPIQKEPETPKQAHLEETRKFLKQRFIETKVNKKLHEAVNVIRS